MTNLSRVRRVTPLLHTLHTIVSSTSFPFASLISCCPLASRLLFHNSCLRGRPLPMSPLLICCGVFPTAFCRLCAQWRLPFSIPSCIVQSLSLIPILLLFPLKKRIFLLCHNPPCLVIAYTLCATVACALQCLLFCLLNLPCSVPVFFLCIMLVLLSCHVSLTFNNKCNSNNTLRRKHTIKSGDATWTSTTVLTLRSWGGCTHMVLHVLLPLT